MTEHEVAQILYPRQGRILVGAERATDTPYVRAYSPPVRGSLSAERDWRRAGKDAARMAADVMREAGLRKSTKKDQAGVFVVLRERDVPASITRKLQEQTIETFE